MIKIIKKNEACPSEAERRRGYALIETLFYVALFSALSLAVISSLFAMSKSFSEVSAQSELLQSSRIMERISREVRQAYDINLASSSDLILKDSAGNDEMEFKLSGSDLQLLEGSSLVLTGNLNAPNIAVAGLTFTQITTAKGKAVKIVLTVTYNRGSISRTENFYDTVVLRGSYI